jgi:hypothetical protein
MNKSEISFNPYSFPEKTSQYDLTLQLKFLHEQPPGIHRGNFYFHRKPQSHHPAL